MSDYEERLYELNIRTDYTSSEIEEAFQIEMDHEREFPPGLSMSEIRARHRQMHENRDDWGHTHEGID